MISELDQLQVTLLWAEDHDDKEIDPASLSALESQYEQFCEDADAAGVDPEVHCLTGGDPYEQLAHDYVLTRMGAGVGFWETSDWDAQMGDVMTRLCKDQGTLETYEGDDGLIYVT
jgi:hypothetical protein